MKRLLNKTLYILTTLALVSPVQAGWVQSKKPADTNLSGWWYSTNDTNTTWLANSWQWIDGNNDGIAECYAFNNDGWMYANVVTPDGYTVNENGAWTVNGAVQTKNTLTTTTNTTSKTSSGGSGGGGGSSSSGGSSRSSSSGGSSSSSNSSNSGSLVQFQSIELSKSNYTEAEWNFIQTVVNSKNGQVCTFSATELIEILGLEAVDKKIASGSNATETKVSNKELIEAFKVLRIKIDADLNNIFIHPEDHFTMFTFVSYDFTETTTSYLKVISSGKLRTAVKESTELKSLVTSIINEAGITERTIQVEAVKKLNAYFVNNFTYDYRSNAHDFSMIDSMKSKTGVCWHYAVIFKEVAQACGIETYYVAGNDHAWNMTIIDGKTTYTDSTWNCVLQENRWLMISEQKLLQDHVIEVVE